MGGVALAAGALAPPPLYPVVGAIYFGTFVAVLYQQKQTKQQRLTEDEKAVSKLNNPRQGSFHILARHYSQFRTHIHASHLPHLSQRAMSLLEKCEQAKSHTEKNRAYSELENYLESTEAVVDGMVLDELQFSIFHYLRTQMTHSNFAGYIVDDQRRIAYYFRIGSKMLRVVLSKQVYNEQPGIIRKKFREIITAYFIDPKSVEGKLKMPNLPMSRRRRRYHFVDFVL
uniref:Uncharacterized protein n=1 Tax=Panagrolaimus davidi TaxID=227884 RepID=A0A914PER3_9BILA